MFRQDDIYTIGTQGSKATALEYQQDLNNQPFTWKLSSLTTAFRFINCFFPEFRKPLNTFLNRQWVELEQSWKLQRSMGS